MEKNTKYKHINIYESPHSEMGPTKPSKCAYDSAQFQYTVRHVQNSSDNLPSYLQITISGFSFHISGSQMLSVGW